MNRMESTYEPTLTRVKWERDATQAPDLHPASNATIAAFAVFGISLLAVAIQDLTGWKWGIAFAGLTALIAFLIVFTLLLIRQSQLGYIDRVVETPVKDDGEALRVLVPDLDNRKTLKVAEYSFNDGQMRRLASALARKGWRLDRDTVRKAAVLPSVNDWSEVVKPRFMRAGLVDLAGNVTPAGRALFEPYLTPAPMPFVATSNPAARRRLSDSDAVEEWPGGVGAVE